MKFSRKILTLVVVCLLLYIVLSCMSPLILFQMENDYVRDILDNPYVNSGYLQWKNINLDGIGELMVPNDWTIVKSAEIYQIFDINGTMVAIGGVSNVIDDADLFKVLTGYDILDSSYDGVPGFISIQSSELYEVHVKGEGLSESFYCISLCMDVKNRFMLYFPEKRIESIDSFFDVAEAVIYSYAML